jgi:hypothetical protein
LSTSETMSKEGMAEKYSAGFDLEVRDSLRRF